MGRCRGLVYLRVKGLGVLGLGCGRCRGFIVLNTHAFFPYPCVFFYPLSLAVPLLQLALAEAASDKVRRQLLDAINSAEDIFHELSHA